jgi:hypothetical protein
MNKKGKTLKAYLYVVFMLIGNRAKAQIPITGYRLPVAGHGQSQALCFFLISNFWFTFHVM